MEMLQTVLYFFNIITTEFNAFATFFWQIGLLSVGCRTYQHHDWQAWQILWTQNARHWAKIKDFIPCVM